MWLFMQFLHLHLCKRNGHIWPTAQNYCQNFNVPLGCHDFKSDFFDFPDATFGWSVFTFPPLTLHTTYGCYSSSFVMQYNTQRHKHTYRRDICSHTCMIYMYILYTSSTLLIHIYRSTTQNLLHNIYNYYCERIMLQCCLMPYIWQLRHHHM